MTVVTSILDQNEQLRDEVVAVLERAADDIETNGHLKDAFGSKSGPKCVIGALRWQINPSHFADGWDARQVSVLDTAKKTLRRHLGIHCLASNWNDLPSTQPDQVIDALRFAAKRLHDGDLEWE